MVVTMVTVRVTVAIIQMNNNNHGPPSSSKLDIGNYGINDRIAHSQSSLPSSSSSSSSSSTSSLSNSSQGSIKHQTDNTNESLFRRLVNNSNNNNNEALKSSINHQYHAYNQQLQSTGYGQFSPHHNAPNAQSLQSVDQSNLYQNQQFLSYNHQHYPVGPNVHNQCDTSLLSGHASDGQNVAESTAAAQWMFNNNVLPPGHHMHHSNYNHSLAAPVFPHGSLNSHHQMIIHGMQ